MSPSLVAPGRSVTLVRSCPDPVAAMPALTPRRQLAMQRLRRTLARPGVRDALAIPAGALGVLGFAPFGWWPLAIVAPALLFLLWAECRRGRAAWRGWLFGLGYWGAGVYWIYFSLHHFGAAIAPLAALLTFLFAVGMALTLALLGALVAHGEPHRRGADWFLLILPAAWVALEWFRSWFLTGFPWLLVGNAQLDTWLEGYAPVAGVHGMGLAAAFTAGVLAVLGRLRWHARTGVIALAAALWIGGAVLAGVHWTRSGALPFDAALVQGSVQPDRKFADLDLSLDRYTEMTRAVAGEAEIAVWPETAVPTFYPRVAERLNEFAAEMAERDTHVVTGVFTLEPAGARYFNGVRQLGPGHRDYRKQHLVPFGEYMPLRGLLGFFERYIEIPMSDIAAGAAGQEPLRVGRYRIGASVCYEAAYPGVIRGMVPPASVLVNVSNDAWFGDSTAPYQHLEIARLRARELGRPMLRATNTGITAVIDHRGDVLAQGPQFEATVVEARVEPRAGLTPYTRAGDVPALLIAVIMLVTPPAVRWYRRQTARGTAPR